MKVKESDEKQVYTIVYDAKLRKPGCILLQAALCSTLPRNLFYEYFGDSNCWLVAPTPDMQVYPITEDLLPKLKEKTDFTRGR